MSEARVCARKRLAKGESSLVVGFNDISWTALS
jgi:hypothetical protein